MATRNHKKRIIFLGSSNLELTGAAFQEAYEKWTGASCDLVSIPFGQYRQEILKDKHSRLKSQFDYVIFLERFEDLFSNESKTQLFVKRAIEEYIEFIKIARKKIAGVFLVANFEPMTSFEKFRQWTDVANKTIKKALQNLSACYLLDYQFLLSKVGVEKANSGKYWHLAKIPFSKEFSIRISELIIGLILSYEGKTARLAIVDLDNTLWGGEIGDDGIQGLKLGGSYPGNAYLEFQSFLLSLKKKGMLLAICSKNDPKVVTHAFHHLSKMILKRKDFVGCEVSLDEKWKGIEKICKQLNLNVSSTLFLDDNPVERELIRRHLPACHVPDLPTDVSEWSRVLTRNPFLQKHQLTQEDLKRTKQFHAIQKAQKTSSQFKKLDDYLLSLEMKLYFEPWSPRVGSRVVQLIQKTNQFNTTTKRYSEVDLKNLIQTQKAEIYAIGFQDRYLTKEIMGVLILIPDSENILTIDLFLMSCRILGRNIEKAVLSWVSHHAFQNGKRFLNGLMIPTDKNQPVQSLYLDHGFKKEKNGAYTLSVTKENLIPFPSYFEIESEKLNVK